MPAASLAGPFSLLPLVLYASKFLVLALYSPLPLNLGLCSNLIGFLPEIGSFFACFHFFGVIGKGARRLKAMQ